MDKIAIVRRNGLGDLLCAIPLYRYLQKKYPKAQITLFVDERNADLLKFFPEKIEARIFPKRGNKYFNLLWCALKARRLKFDLAISAKTSPMQAITLFLFFLGAKQTVAMADNRWQKRLLTHPISAMNSLHFRDLHQGLKSIRLIDPQMKEIPKEFYPKCIVTNDIKNKYRLMEGLFGPFLLLSATTTSETSRMDEMKYAGVVNRLHQECSFSVLLVGQECDRERMKKIASFLKPSHRLFVPKNFEEFMVLLNAADLYFVADGGIAHIGAALDKHAVVYFGMTRPSEWRPLGNHCETLYHPKSVNALPEERLLRALRKKYDEVSCGRKNL